MLFLEGLQPPSTIGTYLWLVVYCLLLAPSCQEGAEEGAEAEAGAEVGPQQPQLNVSQLEP